MRVGRASVDGTTVAVAFEGDEVVELPHGIFAAGDAHGERHLLSDVDVLPPVLPRQMFGTGLNFRSNLAAHAAAVGGRETSFPEIPNPSLKPVSGIVGPRTPVRLPPDSDGSVFHEPECVAVIGAACRRVDPEEATRRILGYCCGNDIQHRGWSAADLSPWRSKGQEGFSPIGPWIETEFAPGEATARLTLDDDLVWETALSEMVFGFGEVISRISMHLTLEPGDLIWSGTSGGAVARAGQLATVSIEGIGDLTNPVESEPAGSVSSGRVTSGG
jgi:2-keto-4-pentenoate hydratase/2-oxohepta-3-ene-1,7-dioic acid hydratase in catechol pathway